MSGNLVSKIKISFKNINHKLFIALLVMGLVPAIYTTLRVFWLGNLPGDWSYSIAGQPHSMAWGRHITCCLSLW
ncbi:MAG: hypothetical protein IJM37_04525 [Lachnospiraceae bacterium]|nr:hypothetical protein [Lachnospiraceae bacterium]